MSNPVSDLVAGFQDLVAQMPDILQPLIVALAGAVPFIEGEGAAAIGIIGGIHPIVAAIAGAAGNFICVAVVVLVTARVRTAVTTRPGAADKPASARSEKFQKAYHRYGTPGVSLLGPLILPTQFTAAALKGTGVPTRIVLFWQGTAIVLWTTLVTLIITGVIAAAT
ncbi:small multidrug efflux protein [Microbacterium sp. EYE_5]|uniref:small multidrug efflux protein n=1 Tax=unclassified Microbacterium TaxID=2609290 RepID=UPI0020038CD3|nr:MULTISPECIES: small multidrug efflux protein [unclassified Microbacterium]MCK6081692.1 small multidrug efflux protein [Microbacterium sp. EYE_382]MCK6086962.1 small multidrug efflux protein [Microbacterium sp. EYE_384]MCK6123540.1 small multidrug efflux protein [Microbacterium sp. EYE_80]MCK6126449.1 small multidrug efflux protein [Microbacterium sp. EYE_79]MCK6142646.1 small multidrug efflux protein [Microbacterium sp. EYE_39]